MKLVSLFLLAGFLQVTANAYSQRANISLSMNDVALDEVIKTIQKQTEFTFFYSLADVKDIVVSNVEFEKASLESILDLCLKGTNLEYKIVHKSVILKKVKEKEPEEADSNKPALQQPLKKGISGIVKDAKGLPLPGATVVVKGATVGTITDSEGSFTLMVPANAQTLVFSFVGMKSQEVTIANQTRFTIVLGEAPVEISDVVVVGYGVQKKEGVVGAISTTKGATIREGVQGADLGVALQGALPGLTVMRSSGRPGGTDLTGSGQDDYAYMYIRGEKTWNNAAPLVLVDGVERPLQNINPQEIEKISVLKDASATAVFGVKGANGVILITTLRGKEGKPKLSVEATYTLKTVSKVLHREDSYEANLLKNYAILNEVPIKEAAWAYIVPNKYLQLWKNHTYPEYLPDVDWADQMTKKWAHDMNMSLNFSGGTKFVKYFGSLSSLHEGDMLDIQNGGYGYIPSFHFDRLNFRSNLDFQLTPTTQFSVNLSGFYSDQQSPHDRSVGNMMGMYSTPPDLWPVKYSDGTWALNASNAMYNNSIYAYGMFGYDVVKQTTLNTDFILNQKLDFITKGLSASGKISYDNTFNTIGPYLRGNGDNTKYISQNIVDELYPGISASEIARLEKKYTTWNIGQVSGSTGFDFVLPPDTYYNESQTAASTYRNLYYEGALNYGRDFGKHSVTGLALVSRQERATGDEFINYREDWVGRVTYSYDRRYNLEVNGAYNGSEKFSNKYRFGFFPSFGAGWTVSNETFFKSLKPVVSNLKFRYSQGTIGSDADIARWQYVAGWDVRQNTTSTTSTDLLHLGSPYLQKGYPFRFEGTIANPNIQWETAKKKDFGIETGFFDNKIKMTFDYYNEQRSNIFMSGAQITNVPDYTGFTPVAANLGRVDAHGWEFELQFNKRFSNGLYLWLTHAWTYATDKVIARGDARYLPDYQKLAGFQIDQPRVILNQSKNPITNWNGVYNTVLGSNNVNVLPGDYATVDYNSDGVVDANDNVPFGNASRPQYTYAPSFGADYKNFGFNMRWYGVYNVEGSLGVYRSNFANQMSTIYPQFVDRGWSPELGLTTDATYPGIRFSTTGNSGYFDLSRAYLRLQHVELTYMLSTPMIKRIGISNLKFSISGEDLYLRSKMLEDFDAPQTTAQGVRSTYPTMKRINFGLSFNFQ